MVHKVLFQTNQLFEKILPSHFDRHNAQHLDAQRHTGNNHQVFFVDYQ